MKDGSLWKLGVRDLIGKKPEPTPVDAVRSLESVAAYFGMFYGIQRDGSLMVWGEPGEFEQFAAKGTTGARPAPAAPLVKWKTLSVGSYHRAGVARDGTLWTWGRNFQGVLGNGTLQKGLEFCIRLPNEKPDPTPYVQGPVMVPARIGRDMDWETVLTGEAHTVALKRDGSLWQWGTSFALDPEAQRLVFHLRPTRVGKSNDWKQIASGPHHILALRGDGSLWSWGHNYHGELGDGTVDSRSQPVAIEPDSRWTAIAAGERHSLALKADGTLWAWGANSEGQLGDGTRVDRHRPVRVGEQQDWIALPGISATALGSGAIRADGSVWVWGSEMSRLLDQPPRAFVPIVPGFGTIRSFGVGGSHVAVVKADGTLWTWGGNEFGELGIGTREGSVAPRQVGADSDWLRVSLMNRHTFAIKTDGSLWLWGHWEGVPSPGYAVFQSEKPSRIGTANDWRVIASGDHNAAGLKTDGTLWTWGYNHDGLLGNGTTKPEQRTEPGQVGTDTDWQTVSTGFRHAVALKKNGTMWVWGGNVRCDLGDGTDVSRGQPVQIGRGRRWVAVAAGDSHTFALDDTGALWGWGTNYSGELGDGTSERRPSPVQIGTDTDWKAVAKSGGHAAALKTDGSLWTWGGNGSSELGDDTTESGDRPRRVAPEIHWSRLPDGGLSRSHTVALDSDGVLWGAGANSHGELGAGKLDPSVPHRLFALP